MSDVEAKSWPWAERFIEVALRALRRLHVNYGAVHIGQQWRKGRPDISELNQGVGVATADELTVCAAIAQEFMLSPFLSGVWVDKDESPGVAAGVRYWKIDQETCYSGSQKRVDMVMTRVDGPSPEAAPEKWRDCFIEAKRLNRWTTDSLENPNYIRQQSQLGRILEDIDKLRNELEKRPNEIFAHLLIWGVWSDGDPALKELSDNLKGARMHQIRWMPIDWRPGKQANPPVVKRWLWVALFEVTA